VVIFWLFLTTLPHSGSRRFFERPPPPSPTQNTRHFWKKKGVYRQARKKRTLVFTIICYTSWKKYGTMLVWIADGERKGDCERREWAARTRKRCAFKDSVSYVPALTTVPAKKQPKKTTCFLDPPHRGLTWFYKEPPSPLNGTLGLCTVP